MVADEIFLESGEGLLGSIYKLEEVHVLGGDGSGVGQRLQIEHATPVFLTIDEHGHLFCELFGLGQGQDLEEFVEGSEAAGKDHKSLGQVGEPELAHEEI